MSAGVMAQTDAEKFTRYNNQTINFNGEKSHVTFDQVGIVWSPTRGRSSYLNLAFNYHKSADFGQILNAANSLKNVSQNKLTAAKTTKSMQDGLRLMQIMVVTITIKEIISLASLTYQQLEG